MLISSFERYITTVGLGLKYKEQTIRIDYFFFELTQYRANIEEAKSVIKGAFKSIGVEIDPDKHFEYQPRYGYYGRGLKDQMYIRPTKAGEALFLQVVKDYMDGKRDLPKISPVEYRYSGPYHNDYEVRLINMRNGY